PRDGALARGNPGLRRAVPRLPRPGSARRAANRRAGTEALGSVGGSVLGGRLPRIIPRGRGLVKAFARAAALGRPLGGAPRRPAPMGSGRDRRGPESLAGEDLPRSRPLSGAH